MARVNYTGVIDSITGKLNGSVFQRNKSGFIMRSVGAVVRKSTVSQTQQQQILLELVRLFNSLSAYDKSLWSDFAALHPRTNDYGRTIVLTGCNYFVHVNSNLRLCQSAYVSVPPVYALPPAVTPKTITTEAFNFYLCQAEATGVATTYTAIFSTPIIQGLNSVKLQQLKLIGCVPFNEIECIQLRDLYNAVHYPQYSQDEFTSGGAIGFRFVNIDSVSGLSTPALMQILT